MSVDPITSREELKDWFIRAALERWQFQLGSSLGTWPISPVLGEDWWFNDPVIIPGAVGLELDQPQPLNQSRDGIVYAAVGRALVTFNASDSDELAITGHEPIDGTPLAVYLEGNRLTVVSQMTYTYPARPVLFVDMPAIDDRYFDSRDNTVVSVYDLSDPESPVLIETSRVDGRATGVDTRDGRLYLTLDHQIRTPTPVPVISLITNRYENEEEYTARLGEWFDGLTLPEWTRETWVQGAAVTSQHTLVDFSRLYATPGAMATDLSSVAVMELGVASDPSASTFVAERGSASVGTDHVYFVSTEQDILENSAIRSSTRVLQLAHADTDRLGLTLTSFGRFAGIADAIDERGRLRLALVDNDASIDNPMSWTNLRVIENQDGRLTTVGQVSFEGRDVLFDGERAYASLAYRFWNNSIANVIQTIDLRSLTSPRVAGTLTLDHDPGNLRVLGDGLLLSVGYVGAPTDGASRLTLIDASDLDAPRVVNHETLVLTTDEDFFGRVGLDEIAYDAASGLLAVPVARFDTSHVYHSSVRYLRVSDTGLTQIGRVDLDGNLPRVQRLGDRLLNIATLQAKLTLVADPDAVIADVPVPEPLWLEDIPFVRQSIAGT
jgi:hypothetical protein